MIEKLQHLPAAYWLIVTTISIAAIYILWGRRKNAHGKPD
jgi:hypothetical protein